jgi:hypothetical protein
MKLLKKRPFSRILILLLVAVLTLSLCHGRDALVLDHLWTRGAWLLTSEDNTTSNRRLR